MKTIVLAFALICSHGHAQELYKWKDADGKLHIGDRNAAPEGAQKMDIKVDARTTPARPRSAPPSPFDLDLPRQSPPRMPADEPKHVSVPADRSKINPRCDVLMSKIVKLEPGAPGYMTILKEFNALCPGITWECQEYERHPEKNSCSWVQQFDGRIQSSRTYR